MNSSDGVAVRAGRVCMLAILILGTSVASAFSGAPSPYNSDIPRALRVGANKNGAVDPLCVYTVRILDTAFQPVVGATVEIRIRFPAGSGICPAQSHPGMSYTGWDVNGHHFYAVTNSDGRASFGIKGGGGWDLASCPNPSLFSYYRASLYVNGVELDPDLSDLGAISVSTPDLNGLTGVNPVDQSLFLADRYCESAPDSPVYYARSDFNGDGLLNPVDFSILLNIRFGGNSTESCAN